MPLSLVEQVDSRRTVTDKYDRLQLVIRLYVLTGTDDDAAAKQFVMDETPTSYLTLQRGPIEIEPDWVDTDSGDGKWAVKVRYELKESTPPAEEGELFTFDTAGGTKHITQAISTIAKQPPTAGDYKGAIGWDGERAKGVDILVSAYIFNETHYLDDALVTLGYKRTVMQLTRKTNDALFKGFAVGEVLFLGVSGSKQGDDKWALTYRFAASENETGIVYGDLPGIDKKGWEHIWVRYEDVPAAGELLVAPKAVRVEQVYYSADFSLLGIGT